MALTTPSTMPTAMDEQGTAADNDLEMAVNCTLPLWLDKLVRCRFVYCGFISIVGILCNAVALWCVVRCPRTGTPIKVILGAIFSCALLTCLVMLPIMAHLTLPFLRCEFEIMEYYVLVIFFTLNQIEIFYISVMALLRALAVWAPRRGPVRQSTAVAVVVVPLIYNAVATRVMVRIWETAVIENNFVVPYFVINYILPVLLTIACYLSTIVAVRRNKCNLAEGQHTEAVTKVMDNATRAMLAVFISNMVFVLPYTIYYMLFIVPNFLIILWSSTLVIFNRFIIDIFFYTHLFVDPLVFVCFSKHHRRRVLKDLKLCLGRPPREEGALTLQVRAAQPSTAPGVQTRGEAKIQENTC